MPRTRFLQHPQRPAPTAGALGSSQTRAQSGVSATIIQERVESLCQGEGQNFAVMLGHAIAHEPGHVTLVPDGHSPRGIMRGISVSRRSRKQQSVYTLHAETAPTRYAAFLCV